MRALADWLRRYLARLPPEVGTVDLRIVGRTLLHATLVGVLAGLLAAIFGKGVDLLQAFALERLAGYVPLRAAGEGGHAAVAGPPFRPWLILVLPAAGAALGGWLSARFAPETAGGGGNASIRAFHEQGALTRVRVPFVKILTSVLTLGTGGAGGREGPTMLIGGSSGSVVARFLRRGERERKILYVAGIAAGVSAVFRTPLGAALFATEVLYRDDFEADALVPAVLASVVSYSTAMPFAGPAPLFAHAPSYLFVPAHLPYFVLLALLEVPVALAFLRGIAFVNRATARAPGPAWLRPGLGGLALGALSATVLTVLGTYVGRPGTGFGILGGGYGAAQVAVMGAEWLPGGWAGVYVLLALCALKLVAASLTVGSGGSAGDFAPSLVLGALTGGALGRALALITGDPRLDPGAFALVGMGALFGGVAHVPLSSMVLVCELAGSYDLIVPLMLAEGVAFVALRRYALYPAQRKARDAGGGPGPGRAGVRVGELMTPSEFACSFAPSTPGRRMLEQSSASPSQSTFPVIDEGGRLVGVVPAQALQLVASQEGMADWVVAGDMLEAPVTARDDDDALAALIRMVQAGLRQLPVVDGRGGVVGFLDEASVMRRLLIDRPTTPPSEQTPYA
jgi:CIC family chloride channel protein